MTEKLCLGSQQSFHLEMTVYEVATVMVMVVKFMFFVMTAWLERFYHFLPI